MEFFVRVREGYLQRAAHHAARIRIVDGSQQPAEIERQLRAIDFLMTVAVETAGTSMRGA